MSHQIPSFPLLPHEASHLRVEGGRKSPLLSLSTNMTNTKVTFGVCSKVHWQDVKPTLTVLVNLQKTISLISAPVCMPYGVSACGYLTTVFHPGIPAPKNVHWSLSEKEIKAPTEAGILGRTAFFDWQCIFNGDKCTCRSLLCFIHLRPAPSR